jgi:glycosyltransferase involved in cell wall biosynthesis
MAAYNAEQTLHEAVASVLNSTHPSDLVIVDDCSRVPVTQVLGDVSTRITILRVGQNGGPARARNHGLRHILAAGCYDYVAIADSDDIVHPRRFATQAAFLDHHRDVDMIATWVRLINASGELIGEHTTPPTDPRKLHERIFFNHTVAHSTCMLRTSVFLRLGLYSERYPAAEDYELTRRIAKHSKIANLPECLVDYRVWSGSVSIRRRRRQYWDRLLIQIRYFEALEWRAWAGVIKSAVLLLTPGWVIVGMKGISYSAVPDSCPSYPIDTGHLRWRDLFG